MRRGIYAKVIRDSISQAGHRLTTMEVRLWRAMLSELNTHRVFSRNSESSRAVPWAKKVQRIEDDPYLPVLWSSEQKGMQGGEEIEEPQYSEAVWLEARTEAVRRAKRLGDLGVHKSIVNRLLEPFMWHTVIVTATSFENFFGLRCNPMADPNIRAAAELMQQAYQESTPRELALNQWHLPYVDEEDWLATGSLPVSEGSAQQVLVKVSAARCARVSYLTQDGKRDLREDLTLYNRLTSAEPMHASPLEHVATPDPDNWHEVKVESEFTGETATLILPRYGNLLGWHQHRFDVEILKNYQAYA